MTCRIPCDLVAELTALAKKSGRSRNDIVERCLAFAVSRIEIEEKED